MKGGWRNATIDEALSQLFDEPKRDDAVKAVVTCMKALTTTGNMTATDAAALIVRTKPATTLGIMERIGLHPSSEWELAAVQSAWLKKHGRNL